MGRRGRLFRVGPAERIGIVFLPELVRAWGLLSRKGNRRSYAVGTAY